MINGVLQRLTITEFRDDVYLVLREQPLLEWLVAVIVAIIALNLAIFDFRITAFAALAISLFFIIQAKIRLIRFDAAANTMTVEYVYLYRREAVSTKALHEISRAYLAKSDDGSTQIILVDVTGEEAGLSVYSRDMTAWKDDIVLAINTVLHEAHKDDPHPEAVI